MDPWTPADRKALGARLRAARLAKQKTLADVGAMFDAGKATVGHWETGTNMPSAEQVARLAREYGTSADHLLLGASEPRPSSWPLAPFISADEWASLSVDQRAAVAWEARKAFDAVRASRPAAPAPIPPMTAEFPTPKRVPQEYSATATMSRKRHRT